jgi:plastocyanin
MKILILKRFAVIFVAVTFGIFTTFSSSGGHIEGKVTAKPSKYQKDTVIYIEKVEGTFDPPKEHYTMDQKNLVFIPHVLPVLQGGTVDFLNSDEVRHNVFSPDGEKYNLGTWPSGEIRRYTFSKCGSSKVCPYTQLCNVHPEMEAYVVVLQNPYYTVTDKQGQYRIENVPPGNYKLAVWNKKRKAESVDIHIEDRKTTTIDFTLKK